MKFYQYQKTQHLFKLNRETHKYDESQFLSDEIEMLKDLPGLALEKVDGQNVGFVGDGNKLSYQGRSKATNFANFQSDFLQAICDDEQRVVAIEQKFKDKQIVFYCELYGNKIGDQSKFYSSELHLMLFDIYDIEQDLFYEPKAVQGIAPEIMFEQPVIVEYMNIQELVNEMKIQNNTRSQYIHADAPKFDANYIKEGYVCYPKIQLKDRFGDRVKFKIKYRDYINKKVDTLKDFVLSR